MIDRLIAFYQRSCKEQQQPGPLWSYAIETPQAPLIKALNDGDAVSLEHILRNAASSGILWGLDGVNHSIEGFGFSTDSIGVILELAYRCGVLPMPNPEQPSGIQLEALADTIKQLEETLGFSFTFPPNLLGYVGLPPKFPFCAAAAYSAKLLCDNPHPDILEIGAGHGLLAAIFKRVGARSYTIIDLPSVAVIAAYVIGTVFDPSCVWLQGEVGDDEHSAWVRFYSAYPNWGNARNRSCDAALNCDSFPEMLPDHQDAYLQLIRDTLKPEGFFLSINHESPINGQRSVSKAIEGKGFRRRSRSPFMLRPGYVEEVFTKA